MVFSHTFKASFNDGTKFPRGGVNLLFCPKKLRASP